ncbi:MAG: hypothetical protein M0D57_19905 [Sphingobacteriales bacterium JAD_PAG50586_3]|nr:MAG: hypothetical protein M0D57_19905 [Sphingobacteriales bacterium JAD_PAG50586_3]
MKLKVSGLLLLTVLSFSACDKDENDDLTSTQKITRQWQIDKYYGYGVDSTVFFNYPFGGYKIDIKGSGQYTERYTNFGSPRVVNGTWQFLNNSAYFQQVDSSQSRTFTVISLEADYLKLKNPLKDQQYWLKPL